jgi:hypothetical protein
MFTFALILEDGTPADPPTITTSVPNWKPAGNEAEAAGLLDAYLGRSGDELAPTERLLRVAPSDSPSSA